MLAFCLDAKAYRFILVIKGAEFPTESVFEKIPVLSRVPKIYVFPSPYSLLGTGIFFKFELDREI